MPATSTLVSSAPDSKSCQVQNALLEREGECRTLSRWGGKAVESDAEREKGKKRKTVGGLAGDMENLEVG